MDFVIGGLVEVVVPESDRLKWFRRFGAYDLIDDVPKRIAYFWSGDGNCHDDLRWPFFSERGNTRSHRRAGRQTVVDEDDGSARQIGEATIAPILTFAPFELGLLHRCNTLYVLVAHTRDANEVLVEHAHATTGKGAHGQLFVPREAELSNDEDIEWHMKGLGNLESNGNAAARKGKNDHIATIRIRAQLGGKPPAGISPIAKSPFHGSQASRLHAECQLSDRDQGTRRAFTTISFCT